MASRRQNFRWEDLPESPPGRIDDRRAEDYREPEPLTMRELTERAERDRAHVSARDSDLARRLGADDAGPSRGLIGGLIKLVALLTGGRK